jgi:hypothetical protein
VSDLAELLELMHTSSKMNTAHLTSLNSETSTGPRSVTTKCCYVSTRPAWTEASGI